MNVNDFFLDSRLERKNSGGKEMSSRLTSPGGNYWRRMEMTAFIQNRGCLFVCQCHRVYFLDVLPTLSNSKKIIWCQGILNIWLIEQRIMDNFEIAHVFHMKLNISIGIPCVFLPQRVPWNWEHHSMETLPSARGWKVRDPSQEKWKIGKCRKRGYFRGISTSHSLLFSISRTTTLAVSMELREPLSLSSASSGGLMKVFGAKVVSEYFGLSERTDRALFSHYTPRIIARLSLLLSSLAANSCD